MQLKDWLTARRMSGSEMARRIGTSPMAVCHYVAGRRIPRKRPMLAIMRVTNGEVGPNDFHRDYRGPHDTAPTGAAA